MNDLLSFAHSPDRPLPAEADVVVIGGGVVGISAALHLAEWGVSVVLCEKGRIAGEQSSRNWGWIRKQGRDLSELPLMLESQALWRQLGPQLDRDIGLRQGGCTYVAQDEHQLAAHEAWLASVRPFQLDSRMLSAAEADALLGQDGRRFAGAITTPSDMQAEPGLAVPALARFAADQGAALFEGLAVRCLDRAGGRITGVVTEHGRIGCQSVILAGGVWSRPFLENMGLPLPQLAVRSQAQRTEKAPAIAPGPIGIPGASIRPRLDGGYTVGRAGAAFLDIIPAAFSHFRAFTPMLKDNWRIVRLRFGREFFGALGRNRWRPDQMSPFEQVRVFDPAPDRRLLDDIMADARAIYPQLAGVNAVEAWGGMIDVTPDELPVIGPVAGAPGLTLATGLSGHGFGIGPGVGLLAAQLATGRSPIADPTPFSHARFAGRS